MRVGIIGLGYRLGYLARVFSAAQDDFSIAGYVDPAPAGLPYTAEHDIDVGKQFDTLEAMLDSEKLDLLMVGSPNHLHLEHIRIG
ncbi:MAG TPA: Gfo/Idh/MocA family oxidoreductase, partial [Devosia sp.]|nr:Gfo/Idh/MocA family oxidoreductase [Devosia sp.]